MSSGTVTDDGEWTQQTPDQGRTDLNNGTAPGTPECGTQVTPTAYWFIANMSTEQMVLLIVYSLCTLVTILVFLETTIFIIRHFTKRNQRRNRTIWVLAVFPMFSLTGVLGFMVPLSAPIVDLVANTFMATCLHNLLELMMSYVGGEEGLWAIIEEGQVSVQFATLPVCCLIPCLPKKKLNRKFLWQLRMIVLQVCVLRPILMFIAAVMWADGTYNHHGLDLRTADPYITVINALTTVLAVFGLNLCKTALIRPLRGFWLGGKVFIIQMVLATCSLTPGITKLFDKWGLVRCDPIYDTRVHHDSIYRGVLVVSMLVYAVTARFLYRRVSDGVTEVTSYSPEQEPDIRSRIVEVLSRVRRTFSMLQTRGRGQRLEVDVSSASVPGMEGTTNFYDKPRVPDVRDSQMKYMDDSIDEHSSLTMSQLASDSDDADHYSSALHQVNHSLVLSD